jgi:putative SOS response-associated peptidase YedK
MCGRFFYAASPDDLAQSYGVVLRSNMEPRYNIAPTQAVLVIRNNERGAREIAAMRWGLVPSWAKEIGSAPLINARAETVAEKPSFRGAYQYRRGILPVSGWYEWRTENKLKMPFAHTIADERIIHLACIWEVWEGRGEGSWLETCALLTTEAIGPAAAVHHRMPVLVHADNINRWMGGARDVLPRPTDMSGDLIDRVVVRAAHTDVNKVGTEGAYLLDGEVSNALI